tara:strand:+ start:110 stop:295 length:186 start_codon:yes stop_codon:yes gene_type:complete
MIDLDMNVAVIAGILWALFSLMIWFGPQALDMQPYSTSMKIMIPLFLLPLSYLIVNNMFNR